MEKQEKLEALREIEVLSQLSQLKVALPKYQDVRNVEKGKVPQVVNTFEITLFYTNQEFLKMIENKLVDLIGTIYPEMIKKEPEVIGTSEGSKETVINTEI